MEIEKADEMGMCFGVRRAIGILKKAAREGGRLETLGVVVHNREVVQDLAQLGITPVENLAEVRSNIVAIPSHGVDPAVLEEIRARQLRIVDATCPIVRKAQMGAKELAEADFQVVIFGDITHPEVNGILGWAGGKGIATLNSRDVVGVGKLHRLGILSQTTQSLSDFTSFVTELIGLNLMQTREMRIINTICDATKKRQAAALALAKKADLMIVIGGYNSANTKRLAEVCAASGVETHQVGTAAELDKSWIQGGRHIGITAGASTPDRTVDEIVLKLRELDVAVQ